MLGIMSEVVASELKKAVESQHGGTAILVQLVPVHEEHNGQTVWDGTVHVFDLVGHPTATRAYARSYVRAAIVAEQRAADAGKPR